MRYVTIPAPVLLPGVAAPLSLELFLAELIYPAASWRASSDSAAILLRLAEKFAGGAPGQVVELTDAEHEALQAAARGIDLSGRPALAVPITRLTLAILAASDRAPQLPILSAEASRA